MKWTLILLACLLVAVISNCHAEEEDNEMKELSELEDALMSDEDDKEALPMDEVDEEIGKALQKKGWWRRRRRRRRRINWRRAYRIYRRVRRHIPFRRFRVGKSN